MSVSPCSDDGHGEMVMVTVPEQCVGGVLIVCDENNTKAPPFFDARTILRIDNRGDGVDPLWNMSIPCLSDRILRTHT